MEFLHIDKRKLIILANQKYHDIFHEIVRV